MILHCSDPKHLLNVCLLLHVPVCAGPQGNTLEPRAIEVTDPVGAFLLICFFVSLFPGKLLSGM